MNLHYQNLFLNNHYYPFSHENSHMMSNKISEHAFLEFVNLHNLIKRYEHETSILFVNISVIFLLRHKNKKIIT